MKAACTLCLAAVAVSLGGCGVINSVRSWMDREPSVPVTQPTEVNDSAAEELATRPPQADDPNPLDEPADGNTPLGQPDVDDPTDPNESVSQTQADANTPAADPNEQVVAASAVRVNREFITSEDILRQARPRLWQLSLKMSDRQFAVSAARIIQEEIRNRIRHTLVLREAEERLKEGQKMYIEEQMADYRRQLIAEGGGSEESLAATLAEKGTTLEAELDAHRRRVTYVVFLRGRIDPAIVVTRRMLLTYYRRHIDEFSTDSRVQMRILAMPFAKFLPDGAGDPSEEQLAEAKKQARATLERAMAAWKDGQSFESVVKKYSRGALAHRGGLWPMMGRGSFANKPVEAAAFKLEQDEISDVVETDDGLYVVQAVQVEKGKVTPFREAQKQIEADLREKQQRRLQEEYLKRLYEGANIEVSEAFTRTVLEKAFEEFRIRKHAAHAHESDEG